MTDSPDFIERYAMSKSLRILPRTVFVADRVDALIFEIAAQKEQEINGFDLLGDQLAVVAVGKQPASAALDACHTLMQFRSLAKNHLLPSGRPKYRFAALLPNNSLARNAIREIRRRDSSIIEYKDVFCIRPVMPKPQRRDPDTLRAHFLQLDKASGFVDCSLEDLLSPALVQSFRFFGQEAREPVGATSSHDRATGSEGVRAGLPSYVRENAQHADLAAVIDVLRAVWHYLAIPIEPTT